MSSLIQATFVLVGPLAGKTIKLGSLPYPFQSGKCLITATPQDMALHARLLERNWQAYPEGHPALKEVSDGQRDIQTGAQPNSEQPPAGDLQPNGAGSEAGGESADGAGSAGAETGEAGSVPNGDGQPAGVTGPNPTAGDPPPAEINAKLQRAVMGLDPADDAAWTKDGKPAINAVTTAYGATDVTRADVEAVAPGFNRDKAKAAAAAQ